MENYQGSGMRNFSLGIKVHGSLLESQKCLDTKVSSCLSKPWSWRSACAHTKGCFVQNWSSNLLLSPRIPGTKKRETKKRECYLRFAGFLEPPEDAAGQFSEICHADRLVKRLE